MRNKPKWIFFLILSCASVWSRPMQAQTHAEAAQHSSVQADPAHSQEQVISVRITSSVAVARGNKKPSRIQQTKHDTPYTSFPPTPLASTPSLATEIHKEIVEKSTMPSELTGANLDFINQLNSKKEARGLQHFESIHTYPSHIENSYSNDTEDSVAEPSVKSAVEFNLKNDENEESIDSIPLARSLPHSASSKNYIQGLARKPLSERRNNPKLTTVSFNIVHDTPKVTTNYNEPSNAFVTPGRPAETTKYDNFEFYNEPAKVYSQPAQVYSEPAKFYSEPSKVYSEPAKVYSEPAKIYSEPSKVYSEPSKFYSKPASLHLPAPSIPTSWQQASSTSVTTTPGTTVDVPSMVPNRARVSAEHQPEKNYEVDEKISVMTDGRSHGVQEPNTENCAQENCKVGYVVEGRQYRKYQVEERTSDGFIVGEYGVVRHEDGDLRGVRYTADGDASPRLIYDALMKFLQLK